MSPMHSALADSISTLGTKTSAARSPFWTARSMCPMADILATAAIIAAGLLASACRSLGISSAGVPARAAAASSPGGISSDGRALFVATGNTLGARAWSDGEAVFKLMPDLHHTERPQDFFAPPDWRALDERDADLGGSNPLPFDAPSPAGLQPVILALGKDARAYLLDRN